MAFSPAIKAEDAHLAVTRTPSIRASSLQPQSFNKSLKRSRRSSIADSSHNPKHARRRSRHRKRLSYDRKALSAEPHHTLITSRRWEDLLDAAASATEEDSRDLTPVSDISLQSNTKLRLSDISAHLKTHSSPRSSLPPFHTINHHNPFQSYNASPLQNTMLPQSPEPAPALFDPPTHLEAFPSVESNFEMHPSSSSQGVYHHHHHHHHPHSSNDSSNDNQYTYAQSPTTAATTRPQLYSHHRSNTSITQLPRPPSSHHLPAVPQDHPGLASSPHNHNHNHAHAHSLSLSHAPTSTTLQQPPGHASPYAPRRPSTATATLTHSHSQSHYSPAALHSGQPTPVGGVAAGIGAGGVQHYCAACNRVTPLATSYACTECICGICRDCVDALVGSAPSPSRGPGCPRCSTVGGRFKPFMLDLR